MKMPCRFCRPNLRNEEIVLESDHCCCRFIQNEQPVLLGSGLIIPKLHRETVFDLTVEEWTDTYHLTRKVKGLLNELHHPDGFNLGWNSGAVAGQEILHAHLHIIPRYRDELYAGKGIRYWLKQEANSRT